MTKYLISFSFFAALALGAWIVNSRTGAIEIEALYFRGYVSETLSPLVFRLDCCENVLELSMVSAVNSPKNDLEQIEQILKSDLLSCTSYLGSGSGTEVDPHKVWCSSGENGLVSNILFERGLVEARCEYSDKKFDLCKAE